MTSEGVCRPERLTTRWLVEISTAIQRVCPSQPIIKIEPGKSLEESWNRYLQHLQGNYRCYRLPVVKKILNYEVDYREVLPSSER